MWTDTTAVIEGGGVGKGMDTLEEVGTGGVGVGVGVGAGAEVADPETAIMEKVEVAVGTEDGGEMKGIMIGDMIGETGTEIMKLVRKLPCPQPKMS